MPGGGRGAVGWKRAAAWALAGTLLIGFATIALRPWRRGAAGPAAPLTEVAPPRSLLDDSASLSRDACILRWTAGPEGAIYSVEASDEMRLPIASARGLTEPQYRIDPEALGGVAPGGRIVWQIEVLLPDGRRQASPSFFNLVE